VPLGRSEFFYYFEPWFTINSKHRVEEFYRHEVLKSPPKPENQEIFMNIAVAFTLSRVIIAPLFAFFFIIGFRQGLPSFIWYAVGCGVLIELSDMFDGMIARSRGEVTDFGKVFDPVADSVSRQTVFISFMVTGIIPLWVYLIFFYRDAFMQLLRIICASEGLVLAARMSGKIKAVLQAVASFAVLAIVLGDHYSLSWLPEVWWGRHPGFWVVLAAALFTIGSIIDYVVPNREILRKMLRPKQAAA
jgi:CDP-diacylglycerol--glycerol-3-phosphate 3-phosphatidyltransferase